MSIRISRTSRSGNKGREGDARYNYEWASVNAASLSEPVDPIAIGETKVVPLDEIYTEHYLQIQENLEYFNNNPRTDELDADDPNKDMTRIFDPIPKQIVKKGALFLFGQQKFKGVDSFKFKSKDLEREWKRIWYDNNIDSKLIALGQSYLRDGDVFYKVVSRKNGSEIISSETVNEKRVQKEREVADIQFLKTNAAHWSAIVSNENPNFVIAWIYQFQKPDGNFVREEYFRNKTFIYEGKSAKNDVDRSWSKAIRELAEVIRNKERPAQIEFTLVEIDDHNLGMFPLVRFKNNEQDTFWGMSIYSGHYGQFDRLNEMFTLMGYALKMHSDPLLWVAGAEVADQNTKSADAVWSFTNPEASLNVLQWQGVPDSAFKFLAILEGKIYEDAFIPRTSDMESMFSSDNRISGLALRELKSDIVDATLARRNDLEAGFKQMIELTVALTGTKVLAGEESVDIVWGPIFESGAAEKREALIQYHKNRIISRKRVIDLTDDFPPEMKEDLENELTEVDRDVVKVGPGEFDNAPTRPPNGNNPRRTRTRR